MKIKQIVSLSIALLFVMGAAGLSFAEVVVIVNPQNSVATLSSKDVMNIYKLKKTTWPDGTKIEAVNLNKKDPVREKFSEAILKKSSSAIDKYYLKQALSGKGQPPKVLNSYGDIKKFISDNKNAIGYIDAKDVDGSVKVVQVDGKKTIE